MLVQFILIVISTVLLWYFFKRPPLVKLPPALPNGLPIFGHLHILLRNSTELWEYVKYMSFHCVQSGGVTYCRLGPYICYMITDPDDQLTIANSCPEKGFIYELIKPWLGNGLETVTTDRNRLTVDHWKRHRKIVNKAFNQQILDGFLDEFNYQARALIDDFALKSGKGAFNHEVVLGQRALESIYKTAMGLSEDKNNTSGKRYVESTEKLIDVIWERFRKFWLFSDFLYSWSKLKKEQDALIDIIHSESNGVIKRKRAALNESLNAKDSSGKSYKAFLDLLLELPPEDAFTDKELREEIDTMIVAGFDTVSTVLTYSLVMIGSHPNVQEKIYLELQEVFGTSNRDVDKQDLSNLIYVEAVLKEVMRYQPAGPILPRLAMKDVKLKNYTIPAGSNCFLMVYGTQHDENLWGADASQFRPERWLDPTTLPKHPAAFGAFSLGKRSCVGKTYAMMWMKTTIAHLLRQYRISADCTKLVLKMEGFLKPASGCQITVEKL